MKSKPPLAIILLFTVTVIIPFILVFIKQDFSFVSLINCFKDFSIPAWILLFSISWLWFRLQVLKYSNYEFLAKEDNTPKNSILTALERERKLKLNNGLRKLNNANASVKSLEIVIAIGGIIAGLIGIASYFIC